MEEHIADTMLKYFDEHHRDEYKKRLSESGDHFVEARRLEGMLQTRFPTLPSNYTHESVANGIIRDVLEDIQNELAAIRKQNEQLLQRPPAVTNNFYNTITNSPNAKIEIAAPAKPAKVKTRHKKQKQSIKYIFIVDDELTLQDRILFSYLCRLTRLDAAPKVNRLRRYTGYRHSTVTDSLEALEKRGYINSARRPTKPISEHKGKLVSRDGCDGNVVKAIVEYNRKTGRIIRPQWAMKVFGISRRTYFRYMASENGWHQKRERMAH